MQGVAGPGEASFRMSSGNPPHCLCGWMDEWTEKRVFLVALISMLWNASCVKQPRECGSCSGYKYVHECRDDGGGVAPVSASN